MGEDGFEERRQPGNDRRILVNRTISLRIGEIVNLKVRASHAITIATISSFIFGAIAYFKAQPTAIPQVSQEWVDRVSEVVDETPSQYLRLGIVEANQKSMLNAQQEQGKDIREIRDDIRAIRTLIEKNR